MEILGTDAGRKHFCLTLEVGLEGFDYSLAAPSFPHVQRRCCSHGVPALSPHIFFLPKLGGYRLSRPVSRMASSATTTAAGQGLGSSPERQRVNWIRKSLPPRCGQGGWRKLRVFPGFLKPGLLCPEQTSSRNVLLEASGVCPSPPIARELDQAPFAGRPAA